MEIRDYVRVLRRGWAVVLAFVVIGVGAGVALILATPKVYQASVQVFVATSTSNTAADLSQGNTFVQDRVQSYTSIATSPDVTGPVIRDLRLGLTDNELAAKITAEAPQNKVLIDLYVTDRNPALSASIANAVAAQFNKVVQTIEQTDADGKSVVKLTIIHDAAVPGSPVKPNRTIIIAVALALGIVLGVGVVILRDTLDNTVKGAEDLELHQIPVMGLVPLDKRAPSSPIAFRGDLHGARSEAFRQLRTNLQFADIDNPPRVIAVTSAMPQEGKSSTALNLAAALAEGGSRVCLVEADLRRPTLARATGIVGDVGLTSVLIGKASVEDVLQNAGSNLAVLTSGAVPPNPSELLASEQTRRLIELLAENVDYTIIDTAPLLPVADGAEIAALADATLLVARVRKTTTDQLVRAVETLEAVGVKPVGAVLSMVPRGGRGSANYGYGYYGNDYRPDSRRARNKRETSKKAHDEVQPEAEEVLT